MGRGAQEAGAGKSTGLRKSECVADDLRNDFYLRNIWGEKLVADAEKLLNNTEIQAFLDNLK